MDQESRQVNKKSILRANIREVKYVILFIQIIGL